MGSLRRSAALVVTRISPMAASLVPAAHLRLKKPWLKTLLCMEEVAIGGRRQIDRLRRLFRLTSSPRCSPTTTISRSPQRSLPSRLLLDTRRVLWIGRHLKRTCSRQGQTDWVLLQSDSRLSVINRQDKIQGTQTHTLENTVFTLANTCNSYLDDSWACTMHISHIIHMVTSRNLPVFSFFSCLLATVIYLLSRVVTNLYCLSSPIGISK